MNQRVNRAISDERSSAIRATKPSDREDEYDPAFQPVNTTPRWKSPAEAAGTAHKSTSASAKNQIGIFMISS